MSTARHDDALNERPAFTGLVARSANFAIELPSVRGLLVACPCNNSIAYYATQCNPNGQIFLNCFTLNETRPGAPPAVRALEQALSWTIPRAHALEPVVSPGYPAGVGRKTAGQALLRFCPLCDPCGQDCWALYHTVLPVSVLLYRQRFGE